MAFVCSECARPYPAAGFCTEDGAPLGDAAQDPLLGQLVGSHRIARLIGRGGMGEVYLGVHPEIGSRVAIKLLGFEAALSPTGVERFFAEARAVNVIRHEGIVSVTDLARLPDGRPYIVMEYLDGAPLSNVLEKRRPVPLGGFVQIVLGVLDALAAAHARGITHRDLKPDNVFVTSMGRTKLLDFGIAKLKPELGQIGDGTRTGALLGTPYYMSPEQARAQPVDARSDLYSVGIILYEGVAGRRPFEADNLFDLLRQQVEAAARRPSELRPDVPPALEQVILRALEKDPALRFQSAAELAAALSQAARFLPAESFETLRGQPGPPLIAPVASPGPAALLPTTPGYAATVGEAPRGRSLAPLWIGLGLIGVVGLLALTAVGTLFVFGDNDTITIVETPPPAAGTKDEDSDEAPTFTDETKVDPVSGYPRALELAKREFADATLSLIVVNSPTKDGRIDVENGGAIVYQFMSPKAAGGAAAGRCAVWVTMTGGPPTVMVPPMASCMVRSGRPPKCSLANVVKRLRAHGEDVTLQYGPTDSWTVLDGESVFGRSIRDDC